MQPGILLFGNVDLPDAGYGGAEPPDRRYGQADVWFTGHHFQHEGFEVVPNTLLLRAMLAMKTERIKRPRASRST